MKIHSRPLPLLLLLLLLPMAACDEEAGEATEPGIAGSAGVAPAEDGTAAPDNGTADLPPGAQPRPDVPDTQVIEGFRADLDRLASQGDQVVRGEDGWLFFGPELRSLAVGAFWDEDAARASRAPRDDAKDPLPAIRDFRRQLEERGIVLLFAPVPTKAALYPREVSAAARQALPAGGPPPRMDMAHREFLFLLAREGIETVDLLSHDLREWSTGEDRLACRQDTHWSGRGLELAARVLADRIREVADVDAPTALGELNTETREVEITGDLWRDLEGDKPPKETLPLTFVTRTDGSALEPDRGSPVLLLGDSHTLVFHAGGDLHAEGAGLFEHLSKELGYAVDLIGVRGSGATPARVNLLRRDDGLEGKKVVVWLLSAREYTEGQGWQKVPVSRP